MAEQTAQYFPVGGNQPAEETLHGDELLVEEVSIDGMCGVY